MRCVAAWVEITRAQTSRLVKQYINKIPFIFTWSHLDFFKWSHASVLSIKTSCVVTYIHFRFNSFIFVLLYLFGIRIQVESYYLIKSFLWFEKIFQYDLKTNFFSHCRGTIYRNRSFFSATESNTCMIFRSQ